MDFEKELTDKLKHDRLMTYKVMIYNAKMNIEAMKAIGDDHGVQHQEDEIEKMLRVYAAIEVM